MAKALLLSVFVSLGCLLNAQTLEIIAKTDLQFGVNIIYLLRAEI